MMEESHPEEQDAAKIADQLEEAAQTNVTQGRTVMQGRVCRTIVWVCIRDVNFVFLCQTGLRLLKTGIKLYSVLLTFKCPEVGDVDYPNNIFHKKFVSCQKLAVDQITNFAMRYRIV